MAPRQLSRFPLRTANQGNSPNGNHRKIPGNISYPKFVINMHWGLCDASQLNLPAIWQKKLAGGLRPNPAGRNSRNGPSAKPNLCEIERYEAVVL
jgi:hypothetical protein